ncbi:Beta-1-3-galactosyltransferase 1-like 7 [Homarus americanus]|uniref:Hexosyltransferase n=1 Tax=Homarus americanus TaxID=6706 RepID=A0A8J5MRT7_HOMAM|nr:Beta-1-3-galactosyltransferase 1-like 7 [Homarus americanus]
MKTRTTGEHCGEKRALGSSRWRGVIRMPRKPRLPTLAAYLLLLSLVLLLYVSVRDSEQDSQQQTADPQLGNQGAGEEPSLGARSIKGTKRRGRTKDLPANPHNFHMMINNANVCSGESTVWLLVLVSSAVANFHRRRAIRDTWGGSAPLTASHAKLVVEESRTYGDILQEDFVDSYMNLTLKSVMGLKWASTYCQQAHYVMKTDDDMYVNIPSLITYLQESRRSRWITGYIMSGDIVKDLYSASLNTRIIPVEDVYVTAHLARSIGVHPPVHDNRFTCGEMVNDDCDLVQVFTGHRITPERMYHIWDKLNPNGITSPCFDF